MESAKSRFLRYVTYYTTSDEFTGTSPSTERQKDLGRALMQELEALKLEDVHMDDCGNVLATLPASEGVDAPVIALIAHMDTAPDASGENVKPRLVRYEGGELAQMSRIWGSRRAGRLEKEKIRRAAVLVPLIQKGGEYHVVFEVRAGSLKTQPGEICFPGGAVERGETPKQAAVRETMEELLINRCQIRVIAPLDVLEAPGAMEISPFLGALQGYRWSYSEAEVDHTFSVPLRWFAEHEPERYETELVTVPEETFPFEDVPGGRDYHWRRGHYDVYFYRREEGIIWGMTAKILRSLAEMYREDILSK